MSSFGAVFDIGSIVLLYRILSTVALLMMNLILPLITLTLRVLEKLKIFNEQSNIMLQLKVIYLMRQS